MNESTEQMVERLLEILNPINTHDRKRLREIVTELKQTDGEHWAVGEMLERACIFLDVYQMTGGEA